MMIKQEIEWEIDEDEDESQNHAGSTIMTSSTVSRKPASSSCARSATSVSVKCEDPEVKLEKVNTIDYNGLLLLKVCQPDKETAVAAFRQGRRVNCSKCWKKKEPWRNMKNEKVWVDEELYWKYTCVHCHMKETGLSHEKALADLKSRQPFNIKRKARARVFSDAMKQVLDEFPGADKSEVRTIIRRSMQDQKVHARSKRR